MRKVASGKVREIYELDDRHLLIVTTDRVSAFDVIMSEPVPGRGRILTALTAFWLTDIAADLPNHFVSIDVPPTAIALDDSDGRCMIVRKAEMLPVELIVRGYLAGSGWREYRESGTLHGQKLPEGLKLGSRLPEPVLTPSTKGALGEHDINLSWDEAAGRVGYEVLKQAEEISLEMYRRGAEIARDRGFILADTKFELGFIDGTLSLCDEVLTPDSSRYWPESGWVVGDTPPSYDKQALRDYLDRLTWNKTAPPPPVPSDVIETLRSRFIEIYERIAQRPMASWPGFTRQAH